MGDQISMDEHPEGEENKRTRREFIKNVALKTAFITPVILSFTKEALACHPGHEHGSPGQVPEDCPPGQGG